MNGYVGYDAPELEPYSSFQDYGKTTERAEDIFYEKKRQEEQSRREQQAGVIASQSSVAAEDQARQTRRLQQRLAGETIDGGQQSQISKEQRSFIDALKRQASGDQPGIASLQLQRALQQQQAATASQIASQRGMNPATAQRLLIQQQAEQQQAMAGQSAEAALAERIQAQQLLGTALGQTRQQDIAAQAAAADIVAGVRGQDIAAAAQSAQAATAMREADLRSQAQALGLYDASGRLDIAKGEQVIKQKLAQFEADFKAGIMSQEQYYKEVNYWRDFWAGLAKEGVGGAVAAIGRIAAGADGGKVSAEAITPPDGFKRKTGRIDGKAVVDGDHEANDTVRALLSPGEIVLPRSVSLAEDAPDKAKKFVAALERSEGGMLSRKAAAKRIAELEAEIAAIRASRKGNS